MAVYCCLLLLSQLIEIFKVLISKLELTNWPGQCTYSVVVQGYLPLTDSYDGADSLRHSSDRLLTQIKYNVIYKPTLCGIRHLYLEVKGRN
jgi:hypothetical protein